jgi:hypothetical protein
MIAKNCSVNDLREALKHTNISFDKNVEFKRAPEPRGKHLIFTLKVKDSKEAGHRLGFANAEGKQRRMASACWHVHGTFFDELLNINPEAIICTGAGNKNQIYSDGKDKNGDSNVIGNWEDFNIGSMAHPMLFSEACECD